ncbi:MAG: PfkB family carbohydrate kinase [Deinococcota bacterium]
MSLSTPSNKTNLQGKRVLSVGLSCIDQLWRVDQFPPVQSRTHASAYRMQGGGAAATGAATIAQLGMGVELWTVHGEDANGHYAKQELESLGVTCDHIKIPEDSITFVSCILVTPDGERYIFPYRGENLTDDTAGLDVGDLSRFDCVLTDARFPVINEHVLQAASAQNIPIVGDFGNTKNWHLARYVTHLIASEECAADVLGHNDPEAALDALRQFDGQLVGITLGEQGFLYKLGDKVRHIPALPVEVVDTNGAGDVFHGAYAYAVAMGWDDEACGLFASVTAALSCKQLGSRTGIPPAQDIEKLLQERTSKEIDEMQWV